MTDAEGYSKLLLHNFSLIGMLAAENREVIDQLVKPNLPTDHALSEEVRAKLDEFADLLFDDQTFGEVDVNLSDLIISGLTRFRTERVDAYRQSAIQPAPEEQSHRKHQGFQKHHLKKTDILFARKSINSIPQGTQGSF